MGDNDNLSLVRTAMSDTFSDPASYYSDPEALTRLLTSLMNRLDEAESAIRRLQTSTMVYK